jgi:hypothetical protein
MGSFNRNNKKEQEAQRLREQRTVLARVFSDENKEIEFIKVGQGYAFTSEGYSLEITLNMPRVINGSIEGFLSLHDLAGTIVAHVINNFNDDGAACGSTAKIDMSREKWDALIDEVVCVLQEDMQVKNLSIDDSIALSSRRLNKALKSAEREFNLAIKTVETLNEPVHPIIVKVQNATLFVFVGDLELPGRYNVPEVKNGRLTQFDDIKTCAATILASTVQRVENMLVETQVDRKLELDEQRIAFSIATLIASLHAELGLKSMSNADAELSDVGNAMIIAYEKMMQAIANEQNKKNN